MKLNSRHGRTNPENFNQAIRGIAHKRILHDPIDERQRNGVNHLIGRIDQRRHGLAHDIDENGKEIANGRHVPVKEILLRQFVVADVHLALLEDPSDGGVDERRSWRVQRP